LKRVGLFYWWFRGPVHWFGWTWWII